LDSDNTETTSCTQNSTAMWKVSAINSRSGATPSCLCPRLSVFASSHGRVLLTSGRRTFQTGTRRNLNSGNTTGGNGGSNNGRAPLVGERITLDPKTKLRMELRKDVNGGGRVGDGNANSGSSAGSSKWATPPGQAARTQNSQYRRAFEESRDSQYGYSSGSRGQNNGGRNQQSGEAARRPGRYVDQRNKSAATGANGQQQQSRQNAPSSFATSAAWGFTAPAPKPPSSFATSASWGFTAPAPKPKPTVQPAMPASKPASAPSTASSQRAASEVVKEASSTAPASKSPAPVVTKPAPSATSPAPSATPVAKPTAFVKSTRTAKENAKIEVARRSQNRRQKQKAAKDVFIPEAVSVSNLAGLLGARMGHFENTMKALGMEITRHDHSKLALQLSSCFRCS